MIIHLKRFGQNIIGHRRKIRTYVRFPLEDLDISKYLSCSIRNAKYDLFAVSNHSGDLNGGHYTSYVMHNREWYHCNDSQVTYVFDPDEVQSSSAYILFYQRTDVVFV
eukprot:TRINITY_DN9029_c0_g1_i3.p1 TRINITY_DN9029_c0_g1~~TRINITY_DN9029_c0_g1_i3.p1  ORF type:complete len:108 (-),score=2.66 TRINITY_DN9029_c0_g1_i3:30-353(-)